MEKGSFNKTLFIAAIIGVVLVVFISSNFLFHNAEKKPLTVGQDENGTNLSTLWKTGISGIR